MGNDSLGMAAAIAERVAKTNQTVVEVVNAMINERIALVDKELERTGMRRILGVGDQKKNDADEMRLKADRATLEGMKVNSAEFEGIESPDKMRKDAEQVAEAAQDAINRRYDTLAANTRVSDASSGRRGSFVDNDRKVRDAERDHLRAAELLKADPLGDPTDEREAFADLIEARQERSDALAEFAIDSAEGWEELFARGDPMKENAAKVKGARARLARASAAGDTEQVDELRRELQGLAFEAEDNQNDLIKARMEVAAALVARDPLKSAQEALRQAEFDLSTARGSANVERARGAVIAAQQRIEDTIREAVDASAQLAITLANAAGDSAEAARLAMVDAQRRLDAALQRGADPGGAEVSQLRGEVASSSQAFTQARVADQEDTINYMLEMGQITLAQAIGQYRLLLGTVAEGSDEFKALQLKIRALEQQGAQDMQFNLPTSLGLPTLYESRRVNQSNAAGIGYQDNRNVSLSIAINGANDPVMVADQVMNAFKSAMGAGSTLTPTSGMN